MRTIALLCILALAALALPACHDGGDGDTGAGAVLAAPTVENYVGADALTYVKYPDGAHALTLNPRLVERIDTRCALRLCCVAGVDYYGCPAELIDDRCPGAR